MLRNRYPRTDLFALVPQLGLRFEPQLEQLDRLLDDVTVLPGARELVEGLHATGLRVVLASSSREEHLDRFRQVLDVDRWLHGWTSSGDVERSKPDAELFDVAIDRFDLDRARTFAIGDTTWDARAAQRAGVGFLAVTTGGFAREDLDRHGAARTYDDVAVLLADLHRGPLAAVLPRPTTG